MRRKILRTVLTAALVGSMLVVPAYAESAIVTGSDVNFRSGPGTNYRVLDCLDYGTELTVNDRSGGTWYAVEYNGVSGFVSAAYLDVQEEQHSEPVQEAVPANAGGAYINAMYVRFRSGPGPEYSILGEYNKGKSVSVIGTVGTWTACVIDGRSGYVYSDYVSSGALQTPAPTVHTEPEEDIYLDGATQPQWEEQQTPEVNLKPASQGIATILPQSTATPQPTAASQPTATPQQTAAPSMAPVVDIQRAEGTINANYVCFRTGPSTNYSIIDLYNRGTPLTITGTYGDWTECTIDGESGYVYSLYVSKKSGIVLNPVMDQPMENENVQPAATAEPVQPMVTPVPVPAETEESTETASGYISGNNVRLREGPSMSSGILGELFYGNDVTITGVSGDWTAVIYNGTPGFVYSQYVREGSLSAAISAALPAADSTGGSDLGRQVVDYALQFVGYNYTWGGKSPSTGFDCSGLVYFVYSQFGYTLNRVAEDQARNGIAVTGELQPGDILCFYSGSSYIGHVGIYIGNGMFVHAQNSATGVVITELAGNYANRGYVARRIIY